MYQETMRVEPYEQWLPRWMRMDVFPSAVRIEMIPLDADTSGMPPLPFFARIPVDWRISEAVEF